VWLIRRHRVAAETPIAENEYRAWNIALVFSLLVSAFLLVSTLPLSLSLFISNPDLLLPFSLQIMPWVPPTAGIYGGDVSL